MDHITLFDIKAFLSVAKYKNFTTAANTLFSTQPTISKSISHMEKELGFTLFYRSSRQVSLTPPGEYLYNKYTSIFKEFQSATLEAYSIANQSDSELKIGILTGYNFEKDLSKCISKFQNMYPNVDINISIFDHHQLLENTPSLNIIFSNDIEAVNYNRFSFISLDTIPFYFAVSRNNPLANNNSMHMKDIADENFIIFSPEYSKDAIPFAKKAFQEFDITPKLTTVNNIMTLLMKVSQNLGVSLVTPYTVRGYESDIALIPIVDFPTASHRVMGILKDSASPTAKLFYQYIKENFPIYKTYNYI